MVGIPFETLYDDLFDIHLDFNVASRLYLCTFRGRKVAGPMTSLYRDFILRWSVGSSR